MKHEFQKIDYSYLRPPIKLIQDHKTISENVNKDENGVITRHNYYYNDQLESEEDLIKATNKSLEEHSDNKPVWWTDIDTLKAIHFDEFNLEKIEKGVVEHWDWLERLKQFELSELSGKYLKDGNVFVYGIDSDGYPTVYVSISNMSLKKDFIDELLNSILYCMLVVKKYCMVPGYNDKANFIVDLDNKGVFGVPRQLFHTLMTNIGKNFPWSLNKLVMYNVSSSFSFLWKFVKGFLDQSILEKIIFVKKGQEEEIDTFIGLKYIVQKYGGEIPDIEGVHWPPIRFYEGEPMTEDDFYTYGIPEYCFIDKYDQELFGISDNLHAKFLNGEEPNYTIHQRFPMDDQMSYITDEVNLTVDSTKEFLEDMQKEGIRKLKFNNDWNSQSENMPTFLSTEADMENGTKSSQKQVVKIIGKPTELTGIILFVLKKLEIGYNETTLSNASGIYGTADEMTDGFYDQPEGWMGYLFGCFLCCRIGGRGNSEIDKGDQNAREHELGFTNSNRKQILNYPNEP